MCRIEVRSEEDRGLDMHLGRLMRKQAYLFSIIRPIAVEFLLN